MWDSKAAAASSEFSATMTMRIFGRSCLISDAMVELSLRAKLNRATVLRTAKRFMDLAST
jgi:hypothetical protein